MLLSLSLSCVCAHAHTHTMTNEIRANQLRCMVKDMNGGRTSAETEK